MATLTSNLDQKAQMAAKAAFDKEYKDCIEAGMDKEEAYECAKFAGSFAYDLAFDWSTK